MCFYNPLAHTRSHWGLPGRLKNGSVSSGVTPVSPKRLPVGAAPISLDAEPRRLWMITKTPMMSQKKKLIHTAVWEGNNMTRKMYWRLFYLNLNTYDMLTLTTSLYSWVFVVLQDSSSYQCFFMLSITVASMCGPCDSSQKHKISEWSTDLSFM